MHFTIGTCILQIFFKRKTLYDKINIKNDFSNFHSTYQPKSLKHIEYHSYILNKNNWILITKLSVATCTLRGFRYRNKTARPHPIPFIRNNRLSIITQRHDTKSHAARVVRDVFGLASGMRWNGAHAGGLNTQQRKTSCVKRFTMRSVNNSMRWRCVGNNKANGVYTK